MKKLQSAPAILLAMTLIAPVVHSACARPSGTSASAAIDDATVTTRVKTAFINDPVVGIARIDVDTFKGVVTLSGKVKTKEDEAKAIALARTIRGVTDVKSTLQIEP
jgi:osmotically-inducible protein OsmY